MFKPENKIIIVDDIQDHLDTLSKPFHENGIGCKSFLYDVDYNSPLKNVRVAFFDIRVNPTGGGSSGQRLNDIATAIKQYVHIDNGPFALIFWTSNKDEINEIKKYIHERHTDCPKPFLVDFIDKGEFLGKPSDLMKKLEAVLSDATLQILFEFENISAQSASMTINQLYEIIPRTDVWGETENFKINFEKVFSKIAISSLGLEHAKNNADKAVYEALLPILNHKIIATGDGINRWTTYLTSLKNSKTGNDIEVPDFRYSSINSIFHLDTISPIDFSTRGAVFLYNYEYHVTAINEFQYFIVWDKLSKEVFSRFVQFSDKNIDEKTKDFIRGNSKFVVIEISAVCDYSQNKLRNNKFVLALLTPDIKNNQINGGLINEAVFFKDLPAFHFKGKDYRLWVNFNFSISDFQITKNIGEPLFILKKEIVDMIGNRYANHVSRIGITSF